MYIPEYFSITDNREIHAFIEQNAFGQLVSNSGGRLFCTHMPFFLSEDRTRIIGHLAKQNPQVLDIEGQEVLITLQGPHDYISPSWYEGAGVPTWNYQAVHIYGQCRTFNEPSELKHVVETLTKIYESTFPSPWQPNYSVSMLGAISGVDIAITDIQCKYKLSQNRSVKDQEQVIEQLNANGATELADAMQRNTALR